MKYHNNQLRDYSSLFSRGEALLWLKTDLSSIKFKIERYDNVWLEKPSTYLEYLKYVYSILASNYQNEYVFKNEFLNRWLISELGGSDSQIFSEFRVGNSIADLVMFNGCSKIFEIKTEFDSDIRLNLQLEDYRKAFNEIYLIVPESKLKIYQKYDSSIGLITFNSNKKDFFTLFRNANTNLEIDASLITKILLTKEYKSIVNKYYGKLPAMTSFNQYKICEKLIFQIPKIELNKLFISEVKRRGNKEMLSPTDNIEFNQLFLALKINGKNKSKVIDLLNTNIQI